MAPRVAETSPSLRTELAYAASSASCDELALTAEEKKEVEDSQNSDESYEGANNERIGSTQEPANSAPGKKHNTHGRSSRNERKRGVGSIAMDHMRDQIIQVALLPATERSVKLPEYFSKQRGALKPKWNCYQEDIRKAREAARKDKAAKKDRTAAKLTSLQDRLSVSPEVVETHPRISKKPRLLANKRKLANDGESLSPGFDSAKEKSASLSSTDQQELSPQASPFLHGSSGSGIDSARSPHILQENGCVVMSTPEFSPIAPANFDTPTPVQRKIRRPANALEGTEVLEIPVAITKLKLMVNEPLSCTTKGCKEALFKVGAGGNNDINLEDLKEQRRKIGFWFCPSCLPNIQAIQENGHQNSVAQPQALLLAPPPSTRASLKFSTQYGNDFLDDDDVRKPLANLSRLISQYTASACTKPSVLYPLRSIVDVPCIKNELQGESNKLVDILRRILEIGPGISIEHFVRSYKLEDDHAFWINIILVFMTVEFVFKNGAPYEQFAQWRETFEYVKLSPKNIRSLQQDNRLRTMKASPRPEEFEARLRKRHEKFVAELNIIMFPLVGTSSAMTKYHKAIATAAQELNLLTRAYTSRYCAIYPKLGEMLDKELHRCNDPRSEKEGNHVLLLAKMFGVKVNHPDGNWRVCWKAFVDLVPLDSIKKAAEVAPVVSRKRGHEKID